MIYPWALYGQTTLAANQGIDNPAPNAAGVLGEVPALPYVVPDGRTLVLDGWGIESYDASGLGFIFPWLGPPPIANAKALPTVSASRETNSIARLGFYLPAGTILNVRIVSGLNINGAVFGWYLSGHLEDIPP